METATPLVQLRGLTKTFGATRALDKININLPEGKIIGILGPNGCGKTTLMKILAGLTPVYEGDVRVAGYVPGPESKALVSFLPDSDFLPGSMNAIDAITYMKDFFPDFDGEKAYRMLETFELDPTQKIKTMSKGMQEKVQLIVAMSRTAKLYLLDEPLGGIDLLSRDSILNAILENYCEGSTLVISTHLIHDVERIFDDVMLMGNGQVLSYANVDAIREQSGKSLEEYFKEVFGRVC